ncbi:glycosyltransferase family 1 protein [Halomonas sp. HNIBRBA4712]|uniref:glycosyltransferase family 1 protein n=1 Tax=Halomonas sp. HNIBRBA4712 TaxID=3373087 RepID=UPI0037458A5D
MQRLRHAGLLKNRRLLLCRSLPEPWVAWLERHRGELGSLYYLIDDDIGAAAEDAALPERYRQRMAGVARLQPRLLALSDAVVASSGQLAERFSHSNVQVLTPPLLAPLPALDHLAQPPSSNHPWQIGFYGTRAHLADLEHIGPALAAVQNGRNDTRLEIMLGEYTLQALATLPRTHTPTPMAWPAFQAYQRRQRVHIGLAPLWPTAFNAGKSFIKFLDIAAMGGVGVYSNRYPYTEVVHNGENGLLVGDGPDQWQAAITWLLENPAHAARMAHQAAADARRIGRFERAAEFWRNL